MRTFVLFAAGLWYASACCADSPTVPLFVYGTRGVDTFVIRHLDGTISVTLDGKQVLSQPSASISSLTINGSAGDDTFYVLSMAQSPLLLNGDADNDQFHIGSAGGGFGQLGAIAGRVSISGGAGDNFLNLDDGGLSGNGEYRLSDGELKRVSPGGFHGVDFSGVSRVLLQTGVDADITTVLNMSRSVRADIYTGGGNDTVKLANGVSLNGGFVSGGPGTDRLDYSAWTSGVNVNLGLEAPGSYRAFLDSTQRLAPLYSVSRAQSSVVFDAISQTFSIALYVHNLHPNEVTAIHLRHAPLNDNGPILVDLTKSGNWLANSPTATFVAHGVALPENSAIALLGGLTVLELSTLGADPLIRGQLLPSGILVNAVGSASGTARIADFEQVFGGMGEDHLVGSAGPNILMGGPGADILIGGPGDDSVHGDSGADILTWSHFDGSDVLDCGSSADIVQISGNLNHSDHFKLDPAGTRLRFSQDAPSEFSLDIGNCEVINASGNGDADRFTITSLTAVTGISALNLYGMEGSDVFDIKPAENGTPRAIRLNGGRPSLMGDVLNVDASDLSSPKLYLDAFGNGIFASSTHQALDLISIESVPGFSEPRFADGFED